MDAAVRRRRRVALTLLTGAVAVMWLPSGTGTSFLPASRVGRGPVAVDTSRTARSRAADSRTRRRFWKEFQPVEMTQEEMMEEIIFPADQMWDMTGSTNSTILREIYPGARGFWSMFWAIIQPSAAFCFLILGASTYFETNIVDLTPFTSQWLWFLRIDDSTQFIPQGIFMCFYGFFGFVLFAPLQIWLMQTNKGYGICEFNQNTQEVNLIRDYELIETYKFDDIQSVVLEWTDIVTFANREILIKLKNGKNFYFQDKSGKEKPKRIMEKKASILANFLGKELEIDDEVS